jgi:methylthioribose-1-phosphate isomerase
MKLEALAIKYDHGELLILDQQRLPQEEIWLACKTIDQVCECIKSLKVRGAPLIGLAALLGLTQFAHQGATISQIRSAIDQLIASRPTAVNLRNYMDTLLLQLQNDPSVVQQVTQQIFTEDLALCDQMAQHGADLLPNNANVITYCNTGALATAGIGTALGVIKKGFLQGKIKHVTVCETRPLLQGGRLTAWELDKANIPHTLICDNMAATVMQQQPIAACLVGADRIAQNGDTANKIGTYNLAILAQYHDIPFYVVAPSTTIDKHCPSANEIIIEQREASEVKGVLNKIFWAPDRTPVFNPAFDITPASLITRFILDQGVFTSNEIKDLP